jgi:hypothetical protein
MPSNTTSLGFYWAFLLSIINSAMSLLRDIGEFAAQTFPPAPKWSTDEIPDLSGMVCIVTGMLHCFMSCSRPD